LLLLFRVFGKI